MNGVIRKATLLVVLGLVAAVSVATAGIPSPGNCTLPAYIDLASCDGAGVVNPTLAFTVTVRDLGNFPIANQVVSISFDDQVGLYTAFPGLAAPGCVEATTNISGVASFAAIPGAGKNSTGGVAFTGEQSAKIYAGTCGGVRSFLGAAHVTAFDENGVLFPVALGGLTITAADLSAWGADYKFEKIPSPLGRPLMYRSNFNHSAPVVVGTHQEFLTSADLSLWGVVKKGVYIASCGTF
jgi:hypothetical protein